MKLTQKDYDARKDRVDAGTGDDEDARLVRHYERQGFTATPTTDGDAPPPAPTSARSRPTRGRN